jgi:ketosteroid isomerase-like protein
MSIDQTVTDYFSAVENGDFDALDRIYDANVRIWHNFSGATQPRDVNIDTLRQVSEEGSLNYAVLERRIVGDRVIQRHNVHFTSRAGATVTMPAAIFITVDNGRITEIDEYVDGAQASNVLTRLR